MKATHNVELSPISFLERAGDVFPNKTAIISSSGERRSYGEFLSEARRLADALRSRGITRGSKVAVLAKNGPNALIMHFAIPGAGAALVALNTRLAPQEYEYIIRDSNAALLFVESELGEKLKPVLSSLTCDIVELPDAGMGRPNIGTNYVEWLGSNADSGARLDLPSDENEPIAINYTSGTTGQPKGAIYTHRGAYLNAIGVALELGLAPETVYLWTLPMFHCNGWCFPWAVTAVGGTHVTLADFEPDVALDAVERFKVTHLCGAPVVLNALAERIAVADRRIEHRVRIATGGAPPSPSTIAAMHRVGIEVIHLYGLTETYGPSLICEMQPEWAGLSAAELARAMARQGVRSLNVEDVRVMDDRYKEVPRDATTMGEIIIRSNTVIPCYHGDENATTRAIRDGWLFTGDLAVVHPDGYIEIRDRRKDIIISGGENVSSIEVEIVLTSHPAVAEAAVVAVPHESWGEVPVAFVNLRPAHEATGEELIEYARERLAHFKAPRAIIIQELPKTSTGKVKKFALREIARSLGV